MGVNNSKLALGYGLHCEKVELYMYSYFIYTFLPTPSELLKDGSIENGNYLLPKFDL